MSYYITKYDWEHACKTAADENASGEITNFELWELIDSIAHLSYDKKEMWFVIRNILKSEIITARQRKRIEDLEESFYCDDELIFADDIAGFWDEDELEYVDKIFHLINDDEQYLNNLNEYHLQRLDEMQEVWNEYKEEYATT